MSDPDRSLILPGLKTQRLSLRQLEERDFTQLYLIRSLPEVNRYIGRPNNPKEADIRNFMDKIMQGYQDGSGFYWVITLHEENLLAGTICLWNFNEAANSAEIGYELLPDYQGKGIMTEAVQCICAYGCRELGLKKITASVETGNRASIGLLEKFGFTYTCTSQEVDPVTAKETEMLLYEMPSSAIL